MKNLKLFAIDIDGVILKDTFSPVLRELVMRFGGEYTQQLERNVFSKNQQTAARYIIDELRLDLSTGELIREYFIARDAYLKDHDGGLSNGAVEMLERLASLNVPMVCYGGLEHNMIHPDFKKCLPFFKRYICTNAYRPGVKEIVNRYLLLPEEVLFIDDVNTVAETCQSLGCGFIGVPPQHDWGWQNKDMIASGVAHRVSSLDEVTHQLITKVDEDVSKCFNKQAVCA
ncbi:HAD family hydrolase [Corallincola luteus]|uniref:HAD family hydrolase n=1 Tax=Corallincola luteus TaxID=1775177 RepID=A0ABY2ALF4_9GAMM|nr:HAD family hydrolase [Corallincola luteus]TCI03743.1 HAD family hydrolase [Corallincola luteus]